MPENNPRQSLRAAVVGAGAVGSALASALAVAGYTVSAIVSRRLDAARQAAAASGADIASTDLEALSGQAEIIFVCVPDDAIGPVAEDLGLLSTRLDRVIIAHTSGAVPSSILQTPRAHGASVLSFHPVQIFPAGASADSFRGITITLEGDAAAVQICRKIVVNLGAHPLQITEDQKAGLHTAAAIASNHLVCLFEVALEAGASSGVDRDEVRNLLLPLLEATCRHLVSVEPEHALTGPILRGDAETISRHLRYLRSRVPALVEIYRTMARQNVRLAQAAGRLSHEHAEKILTALQ